MSEPNTTPPDEYSIEVRSYLLKEATPFTKPAVHNELVFTHNRKTIAAFNGDPYNRETGAVIYPATTNKDTLRVSAYTDGTTRGDNGRTKSEVLGIDKVFTGSRDEFFEKMGQAADAAHSINMSNVDYVMLPIGFTAQNSNSTVGTMLNAMGLQPPESLKEFWSPGQERNLLARDFKSDFTGLSATQPGWSENNEAARNTLIQRMGALNENIVRTEVKASPNPYKENCESHNSIDCGQLKIPGQFFDADKPSVYQPETPSFKAPPPSSSGPS